MDRDLIGYGSQPPRPQWKSKDGKPAKMVIQFVINYEEGGEHCILNGDDRSEWLLSEIVGASPYVGVRHMNMESLYEYGSRVGFWRLHRLFTDRSIPCTVFAVASALAKNPQVCLAMRESDWEIASHGLRWIDYQYMPEDEEREHIRNAVAIHTDCIGTRPLGIYQGKPSPNTRRLVVEEGGFVYDADSYGDEFPYWTKVEGVNHLVVPYTLDANDMRFACAQGFNSGDQFYTYLRDAVDFLREEDQGRVLSIGLHCRLVARPGRARALQRFLDYVSSLDDVWIARRIEIAQYWKNHHPPS
ncbi:MAG: allantoinase PuuE [Deltaproteobacteria bacterium]|nr:allantoinase PuuE [Deltaproteobacteria bacterium]